MFKKFYIFLGIFTTVIISFTTNNPDSLNFNLPLHSSKLISSNYGYRYIFNNYSFHNGIDIPAVEKTPVFASQSGIVDYIGFDRYGYGNFIIILHNNSYKSLYGHLSDNILIKIGDYVTTNSIIGYVGPKILNNGLSNGSTTGPHLHFSIFDDFGNSLDPLTLIK